MILSLIPGYINGYYVCLGNPEFIEISQKRWKVDDKRRIMKGSSVLGVAFGKTIFPPCEM